MIKRNCILLLACPLLMFQAKGERSTHERDLAFLSLTNDYVVMNVSAHPDDEDGASLAYYRMKFGAKTYSVLFTRGEGGQNEIGPELYEELGVIRTEETRAAGDILGAEVYFLNFEDFGYSKTATETFRKWGGKNEVLRRLVYAIRKFKPDILFTNHNTATGHGHHQAVAIALLEAFDAAADSSMFPEQLRQGGLAIWQPKKLFTRMFDQSAANPDVINMVEEVNPLTGRSYLDIASEALMKHRSQGMGATRGLRRYRLARTDSPYQPDTTSFFGGIDLFADTSLTFLSGLRRSLDSVLADLPINTLLQQASALQAGIRRQTGHTRSPLALRLLSGWENDLQAAVLAATGGTPEITLDDSILVPGQRVKLRVVSSHLASGLTLKEAQLVSPVTWDLRKESADVQPSSQDAHLFTLTVPGDAALTLPRTTSQYHPLELDESLRLAVHFGSAGGPLRFVFQIPHDVAAPVEISTAARAYWILPAAAAAGKEIDISVTNRLPHKTAGVVQVELPAGWHAEPFRFAISAEDSAVGGKILVRPPRNVSTGEFPIRIHAGDASVWVKLSVFDVSVTRDLQLGVITSYDNTLESVAENLGLTYAIIDDTDLAGGDLSRYGTIVVDIRAYGMREKLVTYNTRLLEYVRQGGNLVVMYQKTQDWKPGYAPYPFSISRRRVVEEDGPMRVLEPKHPLFNFPNRISEKDWQGWVQERGVYFPSDIPPEYHQLLSSNDHGEPPLTTGYLTCAYGKGSYIYTSYVWYRQMKELHSGVLRCFANMLSYPGYREGAKQ
jgi:LmbE family N-acetylglucosaminyl deacetylase